MNISLNNDRFWGPSLIVIDFDLFLCFIIINYNSNRTDTLEY